jgi:hypothetical protein
MKAQDNINKFNECVKQIRAKFDGISNKIPYGIPNDVWNFFYKKQVVPLREEFCPEASKKMKEEYEAEGIRRKEEAKRKKEEKEFWKERKQSESKNFLKLVSIDSEKVVYKPKEGTFQTSREDFDKDFVVKDGKIVPNDDYQTRLDKIGELLNGAATDFIMSKAKICKPGDKLTWMLMFGHKIEEIKKLDQRLNGLEIIGLIRQRINLVVGPGWWDHIKEE